MSLDSQATEIDDGVDGAGAGADTGEGAGGGAGAGAGVGAVKIVLLDDGESSGGAGGAADPPAIAASGGGGGTDSVATPLPLHLAVVGGRDFSDHVRAFRVLDSIHSHGDGIAKIISGGARGADALGAQWAARRDVPCTVHEADWGRHGKAAGPIRNTLIVRDCNAMVAFWDGASSGTRDSITKARGAGVRLTIERY